jgi:hypothetical protein
LTSSQSKTPKRYWERKKSKKEANSILPEFVVGELMFKKVELALEPSNAFFSDKNVEAGSENIIEELNE